MGNTTSSSKLIGYRKPGTAFGKWDGAFVASQKSNGEITTSFFSDKKDWIAHPLKWVDVESEVNSLTQQGWTVMDMSDIEATSGMTLP